MDASGGQDHGRTDKTFIGVFVGKDQMRRAVFDRVDRLVFDAVDSRTQRCAGAGLVNGTWEGAVDDVGGRAHGFQSAGHTCRW